MRCASALAAVLLAVGLGACGGADETAPAAQAPAATPAATIAQAAPPAATATATVPPAAAATATATAPPAAAATATAAPSAAPGASPTRTAKPSPTATVTPAPTSSKPKRPKATSAQLGCLASAGLKGVKKSGSGLWSGNDPKSNKVVAIDGPYKSHKDAQSSLDTLVGISDGQIGGHYYVVSAFVDRTTKPIVLEVADCLDARARG